MRPASSRLGCRSASALLGAIATLVVLAALAPACGGASEPAKSPSEAPPSDASKESSTEPEPAAEDERAPPANECDDGTCFSCGSGFCPSGWYCDDDAPGGAACSWLPACGAKAGCACVGKALPQSCSCSEGAGGGVHVRCP